MAGEPQPLDQKFPIVDSDGRPTIYFIEWAQQRQQDIAGSAELAGGNAFTGDQSIDGDLSITGTFHGNVPWGSLTGTLSDQTDLQTALDEKANLAGGNSFTGSQIFTGDFTITPGYTFRPGDLIELRGRTAPEYTLLYFLDSTGAGTLNIYGGSVSDPTTYFDTDHFIFENFAESLVYLDLSAGGASFGVPIAAPNFVTFTAADDGLVPASGGGTTKFLRADGTWAVPAGGGGGTTTNPVTFDVGGGAAPASTFDGSAPVTVDYHTVGAAKTGLATGSGLTTAATKKIVARKSASGGAVEEASVSEILDFLGSAAQGDIAIRGSSGWILLGAGTSGNVLQTNGAGANPTWVPPSGGSGGGLVAIAQVVLAVAAANIDFTGIPNTYENLMVEVMGRGSNASNSIDLYVRFNGDSAANYDYYEWHGFGNATVGSGVSGAESLAQTAMRVGILPAASAGANRAGVSVIHIPSYARTTFYKKLRADMAASLGLASFTEGVGLYSGEWRNTAAINQVTLVPSAGNFAAGTVATLYGLAT